MTCVKHINVVSKNCIIWWNLSYYTDFACTNYYFIL